MSNQDWKPVVFHTKTKKGPTTVVSKPHDNKKHTAKNYREDEEGMPIKKTLPKNFGQKMAEARKQKGWTQKELAQKLNCKTSEIQQYEQNRHSHPNKEYARKIERKLGTSLFK